MNPVYPMRTIPSPPADFATAQRANVEYRWQRARADYEIGLAIGAFPPSEGGDAKEIIASIYAAYLIADSSNA